MEIDSEEFRKLFNLKERLPCAGCGGSNFRVFSVPNASIEEAVMMQCTECNHTRLELVK